MIERAVEQFDYSLVCNNYVALSLCLEQTCSNGGIPQSPTCREFMSSLRSALRKHLHFIVVVGILLVVMTWPTIVYVFDTETFWLPTDRQRRVDKHLGRLARPLSFRGRSFLKLYAHVVLSGWIVSRLQH